MLESIPSCSESKSICNLSTKNSEAKIPAIQCKIFATLFDIVIFFTIFSVYISRTFQFMSIVKYYFHAKSINPVVILWYFYTKVDQFFSNKYCVLRWSSLVWVVNLIVWHTKQSQTKIVVGWIIPQASYMSYFHLSCHKSMMWPV